MLVYEKDNSISSMGTHALQNQLEEQPTEPEAPPPDPLQPVLEVHQPLLLDVSHGQASFQCNPPDWSLPSHDDQQAEFQKCCVYALEYELQVHQADLPPPSADAPAEVLLQQVVTALSAEGWRSVKSVTGPVQDIVQVGDSKWSVFQACGMMLIITINKSAE